MLDDLHAQSYGYFQQEAPELLQTLEHELLSLGSDWSVNKAHTLMRTTHTLKGAAASVGLEGVKGIAHRLEDLFRGLCQPDIVPDRELEALLFEGFECLRQPLSAQLSDNPVATEPYLERVEGILAQVQDKLGDAFQQDAGIPTAAELGFDLTLSIFESGVSQRLEELQAALSSQSPGLADLLSTHASIFQGLAESLALPGFGSIADAVLVAIANQPEQAPTIARLALAAWQAGHQAVLAGDRDRGGEPSADLLALADGSAGSFAAADGATTDLWATPESDPWGTNLGDFNDDFWSTPAASADTSPALPDGFWEPPADDFWAAAAAPEAEASAATPPADFWGDLPDTDSQLTSPPDDFWGSLEATESSSADLDTVTPAAASSENDTPLAEDFWGGLESDPLPESEAAPTDDFWGSLGTDEPFSKVVADAPLHGGHDAAAPENVPDLWAEPDDMGDSETWLADVTANPATAPTDSNALDLSINPPADDTLTDFWGDLTTPELLDVNVSILDSAVDQSAVDQVAVETSDPSEPLAFEAVAPPSADTSVEATPADSFWAEMDSLVEQATQTPAAPAAITDALWETLEPEPSAIANTAEVSDITPAINEPEPTTILPASDFWGELTPPAEHEPPEPKPLLVANLWDEIEAVATPPKPTAQPKPAPRTAKPQPPQAAKAIPTPAATPTQKVAPPKAQPTAEKPAVKPVAQPVPATPPPQPTVANRPVSPQPQTSAPPPVKPVMARPSPNHGATPPPPKPAPSAPKTPVIAQASQAAPVVSVPPRPAVAQATATPKTVATRAQSIAQPTAALPPPTPLPERSEVPFNSPSPTAVAELATREHMTTNSGLGSTVAAIAALKAQTSGQQLPIPISATPVAPPPKAPQAPAATVRININHLEALGTSLAELLTNQNRQSLQDEQLQQAVQMLHYRLQQHKALLVQLREWSDQQLINPSRPMAGGLEWQRQFDSLELDHYNDLQVLAQTIFEDTVQLEEATDAVDLFARQLSITRDKQQRLLGTTRDVLMEARLLPLQDVLGRFERVLQQLETRHEKPVQLVVRGGDVMIDKTVAEKLYDPLLHIVRNAFDHGLEAASDRAKLRKPAKGQITIRAHHRGTNLFIDVSDDGKGLDYERIRQKAVAQKRVTAAQAQALDRESLTQFLFEPGFSTAASVSDLSGRGVGLDVVKTQLEALQGDVSIQSKPGHGSTFRLQIPLNLTIVQLLLCEVGETPYALLAEQVEHILNPKPEHILQRGGDRLLRWGSSGSETLIPLRRLSQLLDYRSLKPTSQHHNNQRAIILLRLGESLMGLEVDQVLREQELVVRPFSTLVRPPDYVAGGSILADGRLTLVLDGVSLLRTMVVHSASPIDPSAEIADVAQTPAILVVEDSVTVRQTLSASLQRAGYTVVQARDGQEAADLLNQGDIPIQLIVSDVEMPRMNGFELLNFRQGQPRLQAIPMMMLTSRSSTKHQQLALGLGANAYLTKPYLEQQLLNQVAELLA